MPPKKSSKKATPVRRSARLASREPSQEVEDVPKDVVVAEPRIEVPLDVEEVLEPRRTPRLRRDLTLARIEADYKRIVAERESEVR
jgi:hypothetical protein